VLLDISARKVSQWLSISLGISADFRGAPRLEVARSQRSGRRLSAEMAASFRKS